MQRAGREEGIEQTMALAASGGAGKAAKAAFAAAAAPPPGRVCKRCRTAFLSDNGLLQHKCAAARARRSTIADRVLQSCRASAAAEEAAARKLRSVTATYTAPESSGGWDAVLGMTVGETGRVEGTVNGGATDKMMTVEAGWRVLTIGGTEVTGAGDCETAVDAQPRGKKFDVVFERTLPPVPQRGWARKAFAQKARTAVTDECRAFLDEQFAAAAEHGLKARAAAVHKAMNSGALDAQHCVGVSVRYIEALFSRKSRAAKDAALRAIIKGEDEDDETGEEGEEDEDEDKDEDTGPEDKEVDDDGWGTGGDGDEEDGE